MTTPTTTVQPPRRCFARLRAGLLLFAGSLPLAAAQEPTAGAPQMVLDKERDSISFSINEANGMELAAFIEWAQEVTGKRLTYLPADLQGVAPGASNVSFLGTFTIERSRFKEQFFSFFQTMLYIRGFAVVPRGEGELELWEIVRMGGARGQDIEDSARYVMPADLASYRYQSGVSVVTTVPLVHVDAASATASLRNLYPGSQRGAGGLRIGNVGSSSLFLKGFGPQVYAIAELLKLVDVPSKQPNLVVQVLVLEHRDPEEVEKVLVDVLDNRATMRAELARREASTPGAKAPPPRLSVVVDAPQRALVLSGSQDQIHEALELIARIDVPIQPGDGSASVIPLKNTIAEELVETLRLFLKEERTAATAANGPGNSVQRRAQPTVVHAHRETNSLLVSASGAKWRQLQAMIDKLDRRPPQVLVECAIVELTTSDLDRFGVELGILDLPENGSEDFTRAFGYTSFGQSVFSDTDDDGLPDTRFPDFDNPLQGITGGFIAGDGFSVPVLVNALATNGRANILSLPNVLVNNNEPAVVSTEEERPTTNNSQTQAGFQQQGVGDPRQAGITLEISPTISPNNYLRLSINLVVSRFVGRYQEGSVTGGGIIVKRTIKTKVTMPNDATMVIGGVIEDVESEIDGGIPFLKDIPLLGALFRRSEDENNKTNLYFFVTPTILDEDGFQDLYAVSLQKKLEAQDYIGERRLRLVDRRWSGMPGDQARTLEDLGATVEDLDMQGEYEMPTYRRNRLVTKATTVDPVR